MKIHIENSKNFLIPAGADLILYDVLQYVRNLRSVNDVQIIAELASGIVAVGYRPYPIEIFFDRTRWMNENALCIRPTNQRFGIIYKPRYDPLRTLEDAFGFAKQNLVPIIPTWHTAPLVFYE